MKIKAISHIGHREENQDAYFHDTGKYPLSALLSVIDGMGGLSYGLEAALTTRSVFENKWNEVTEIEELQLFAKESIKQAHEALQTLGERHNTSVGAACALLFIGQNQTASVHTGDCRIIQLRDNQIIDSTIDFSVAQILLMQGKIAKHELADHASQNKLTSYLGMSGMLDFDIKQWHAQKNDTFVVCSDGFWELFNDQELITLLQSPIVEDNIKQSIEQRIMARKNHDNSTVIIAQL